MVVALGDATLWWGWQGPALHGYDFWALDRIGGSMFPGDRPHHDGVPGCAASAGHGEHAPPALGNNVVGGRSDGD